MYETVNYVAPQKRMCSIFQFLDSVSGYKRFINWSIYSKAQNRILKKGFSYSRANLWNSVFIFEQISPLGLLIVRWIFK